MDITFTYIINISQSETYQVSLSLDDQDYSLKPISNDTPPKWAMLDHQKCDNCPLSSDQAKYCPVAQNMSSIIDKFKNMKSFSMAKVTVEAPERSYVKETSLQRVLASVMGLVMATSGCPHMDFFKKVARFHLPFASSEETYYRILSSYLMQNMIGEKSDRVKNISLGELEKKYEDIQKINSGILSRIKNVGEGDADANAIIILHALSYEMKLKIADTESVLSIF